MEGQKAARSGHPPVGQRLPPSRARASASTPTSETPGSRNTSLEQRLAARANSGVVNALAAAAAAGLQEDKQTEAFSGRKILDECKVVYDISMRSSEEQQPQLPVSAITKLASEPFYEVQQRITVNDDYICYSLKAGQIRALHKSTGCRALLKSASAPPDIRFASNGHPVDRLASADLEGSMYIWEIELEEDRKDDKLTDNLFAHITFATDTGGGSMSRPQFAWHPNAAGIIAMAAHEDIFIVAVEAAATNGHQIAAGSDTHGVIAIGSFGTISSLSFSANGDRLAAVSSGTEVFVWELPHCGLSLSDYDSLSPSNSFEPSANEVCSTAQWLSSSVLLTGSADNSLIKLWYMADHIECLQTVHFHSSADANAIFNHMAVQPEADIVILANARQTAVYTLHFSGSGQTLRFDYLAEFTVSHPILSITAHHKPSEDPSAMNLYCVQTSGIHMYQLNLALCCPTSTPDLPSTVQEHSSEGSAPQQPGADVQDVTPVSQAMPSPVEAEHQAAPALDLLSGPSPPLQQPQDSSQQQQPPAIRTVPTQVEQPKLLTPTHLMQQAKRSASQSSMASLPSQHTPTSASRVFVDNSDAVSTASTQGSKAQDVSVSRQQSTETIPTSAAALDASTSVQYDSPTASISDSRANTPPPSTPALPSAAYLTPEQYNTAPQPSSSDALPSTGSVFGHSLDLASTTPGSSTVKLLKREEEGGSAGPSEPPGASAALSSAVFSQPLDLLPVHDAAPQPSGPSELEALAPTDTSARQQQAQPGVAAESASAGQTSGGSELSDASVKRIADAVAERTLAQHKRVLSYLNEGHREMLRIIKADIGKEGKRLQLAFDAQVNRIMKTQGGLMAEDRQALLAEQQASMERLVSLISASINRDLPLRMEEIVRAEVSSIATDFQQSVGSAVQAALSQTLPQELAGPQLRATLEASLGSQLQWSLAQPLQDSFTSAFQHQLMPAFEGACRDMFAQVQATFAGGLSEHLQAAGGANAGVAASLHESLGTAAQLVDDLKTGIHEGQNKLIQLASQKSGPKAGGFTHLADIEARHDPSQELLALIKSQKYEEAFHKVLTLEDVGMVAWLCSQVDPGSLLSQRPPALSQQILLSLIQQLGYDLFKDTLTKLKWIQSTSMALDAKDPLLAPHVKPILDQLHSKLQHVSAESPNREAASQALMCLHLINSVIHHCIP
ncbi:TPA: hypothetical protein ACH3X2_001468 [Trebouxia sp. C0005]